MRDPDGGEADLNLSLVVYRESVDAFAWRAGKP